MIPNAPVDPSSTPFTLLLPRDAQPFTAQIILRDLSIQTYLHKTARNSDLCLEAIARLLSRLLPTPPGSGLSPAASPSRDMHANSTGSSEAPASARELSVVSCKQ